ncbi:MAG: hypothetical protein ACFE95_08775 [Candidatus Hodarchaeota archaeon]
MTSKRFQYFLASLITMSILINIVSSSNSFIALIDSWDTSPHSYNDEINNHFTSIDKIRVPLAVSQDDDNTTELTNTTTTTTATTTEDTNTTDSTDDLKPWKPIIDEGLHYPLALIFSVLGILSTLWLIFFVETSKERTIRERIIGSAIRLILMSLFLGLALHFWILFEPI